MTSVYKLYNQIKHYEWGSSFLLPDFLGQLNDNNLPFAEMWMGTHSGASSQIDKNGKKVNLTEISDDLPFMLKLLAVEKNLSIQAHPEKEKAVYGFQLEEKKGISLTAHDRCYKDMNQKSEIICALSPFKLMAGFKEFSLIIESFEMLSYAAHQKSDFILSLVNLLKNNLLSDFFKKLFSISKDDLESIRKIILSESFSDDQWELMKQFAVSFPQDPCFLSPLFLNILTLQPGQAVFIPAGILHAYLSGFGVELMNNSDNVLRGGLTSKYINFDELLKILKFETYIPQIINPVSENIFYYDVPCNYKLSVIKDETLLISNENIAFPAVCIVTDGEVFADNMHFKKGESFFIAKETEQLPLKGKFTLYTAHTAKEVFESM
ncbi:MAG: mannose-6-phosphate isomerase, class I [Treponema sp.]|nr:mannose-6-phosphate isomerase, class I [Treponema sp.]MCL2251329.1 mannose-6-phosphate isomerase, class I [Treponema sp.]